MAKIMGLVGGILSIVIFATNFTYFDNWGLYFWLFWVILLGISLIFVKYGIKIEVENEKLGQIEYIEEENNENVVKNKRKTRTQKEKQIENKEIIINKSEGKFKIGYELDLVKAKLVDIEENDIKSIYYFDTEDEIQEWRNKKHKIELKINKSILNIEVNYRNRRQIILTCVPIDRYLPNMITWDVKRHADIKKEAFKPNEEFNIIIGESLTGIEKVNLLLDPHLVICGSTGSGKSVLTQSIIYQYNEKGAKVIIMDYKRGVDYVFCKDHVEMVIDRLSIFKKLEDLIQENEARLDLFLANGVSNLQSYNAKVAPHQRLSRICIIIDEATDLVKSKSEKELCEQILEKIETLTAKARASGIHVTLTTQKASAKVFGSDLKDNLRARVIGYMASDSASRTMLDNCDAARIPNIKGRFIVKRNGQNCEIQCPFFKDNITLTKYNHKVLIKSKNNEKNLKIAK